MAAYWAMVHELWTAIPSKFGTPLDFLSTPTIAPYASALISARGSNPDILRACQGAALCEAKAAVILSLTRGSKLEACCQSHPWMNFVQFQSPTKRDGFLATNSLLAFAVLILRAYCRALGGDCTLPVALPEAEMGEIVEESPPSTYSLLYASWGMVAARDIESKLVESGLASVHFTDVRNFAHGRHYWLTRHSSSTSVITLESPAWERLFERTLALLPPCVPVIRIRAAHDGPLGALELLTSGFRVVGRLAALRGIDPGRPSVPQFGRRLYHMPVPLPKQATGPLSSDLVLRRKFGDAFHNWPEGTRRLFITALKKYLQTLRGTSFGAVVFDYDETLCPSASRFGRLPNEILSALLNVMDNGIAIGIASGRGRSVWHSLRGSLPESVWGQVVVGYYNGGLVLGLNEDEPPCEAAVAPALIRVHEILKGSPQVALFGEMTVRPWQITLAPHPNIPLSALHEIVLELLAVSDTSGASALRSSHSVDVVPVGTSKLKVVDACSNRLASGGRSAAVLCIADSGKWFGNDLHLLSGPLSLSVNECPITASGAWNLAPRGSRGPQATLAYIQAMRFEHDSFRIDVDRLVGSAE